MARTRKSIQPLNLYKYDVLIEDRGPRSEYFKISQFDGYFYGGRNAFLVAGATVLRPNSKILVEILNSDGTTIYSAPVPSFVEGNSRLIKIEIYDDTPIGAGKIVILGCTDSYINGSPVPQNWREKYNVRWITDVIISPLIQNKTPIRFIDLPNIDVKEKFYLTPGTASFSQSVAVSSNVELTPKNFTVFQNGYLIKIPPSDPVIYTNKFLGGKLTGSVQFVGSNGPETASIDLLITKIYNSNLAESVGRLIYTNKNTLLEQGFLSSSGQYTANISPFGQVGITSSVAFNYSEIVTTNTGSSSSYAEIRLTDLGTISGEIYKTKISYKSVTTPSNYVTIADIPLRVKELLSVDSGSKIVEIGKFSSVIINDYWYAATMSIGKTDLNPVMPIYYLTSSNNNYLPIKQVSVDLLDAIEATPNITNGLYENSSYFIGTTLSGSIELFPRSEYTLSFDALVSKTSASTEWKGTDASLEIYLVQESGSSAKLLETNPRGQLIGTLTPSKTFKKQNFDRTELNFTPKIISNGTFGLRFVVYGAFWNIANISLKPATEPYFSPDEVTVLLPNEFKSRDLLTFKAEYLDVNNNSIGIETISTPTYFTGSSVLAGEAGSSVSSSYAATASYVTGVASVAFTINGGSNSITTGFKGSVRMPTNVTLSDVALYTSGSGSINIDIRRYNHTTFEPLSTTGTSIVGTPLSMSNNVKYRDLILTEWTTNLSSGDVLNFFVSESAGSDMKVATIIFNLTR